MRYGPKVYIHFLTINVATDIGTTDNYQVKLHLYINAQGIDLSTLSQLPQVDSFVSKYERWQRSGINTIKYHTYPRISHRKVTKTK